MARSTARKRSHNSTAVSSDRRPRAIKTKMTKAQLTKHIIEYVEENVEVDHITSVDVKRIVTATLEGLADTIERSIAPRGLGEFMMPQLFKVTLKKRLAIRKGTMVRSPATGGMVPSKGRPASKSVKIRPLARLKRAAAGEL